MFSAAPDQRTRFIPKSDPTPPPAPFAAPEVMAERKRDAEARPLFASEDPLPFTLAADFKAIDKDRDPESTVTFPGTITFAMPDGAMATRPVRVRGRGHTRRDLKLCDFMPLRIEFTKAEMAGTVFAGHNAIKLGTHCRSVAVFEQYVLREYTAYKIFNLVTPRSFRARLASATYVDTQTGKTLGTRFAMFLEDDDDVARRMEGRVNEQRKFGFAKLDADYLTLVALFEYLIGNTDVAFSAQHNIRVVETPSGTRYAVPYDFDYSGLVNASYAVVDKARVRGIDTVRDRRYLGPCRSAEALEPLLARMREVRADIEKLYGLAGLTDASRKDAKGYIDGFYRTLERPADVKRAFIDVCEADG